MTGLHRTDQACLSPPSLNLKSREEDSRIMPSKSSSDQEHLPEQQGFEGYRAKHSA
jgi:hypothetical protein